MKKINKKNLVVLTMGDPSGIGTEITIKSWKSKKIKTPFFVIHDPLYVEKIIKKMGVKVKIKIIDHPKDALKCFKNFLPVFSIKIDKKTKLGFPNKKNSRSILESINKAVYFVKNGDATSMVTNPISKEVINKIQKNFKGHTEYLAKKDKQKSFCMMMINSKIKAVPLTTHLPLKKVSQNISEKLIVETIQLIHKTLKKDFKKGNPKIAITGLNPHSGDKGVIGDEEKRIIIPAIKKCKKRKIRINGPISADSAFISSNLKIYDAFLCMYHDQALIAAKVIDFENTVNYTAGLSYVRTSPDHGTGFDISKKFIANETSLISAINNSILISKNR
tara:strand:- start:7608 stop:8606 length:999 start_codon:yes stop_codon:yes gene_type:complete